MSWWACFQHKCGSDCNEHHRGTDNSVKTINVNVKNAHQKTKVKIKKKISNKSKKTNRKKKK
jgi:hypothetical protein